MFVAGQDLGSTLLWLGMALGLVAAVTALAVWSARRRGRGGTTIVLDATATLAPMGLVVLALGFLVAVWRWFTGDATLDHASISTDWPGAAVVDDPAGAGPALTGASITSADLLVANLSIGTRTVLALGDVFLLALWAMPTLAVAVIAQNALKGVPFTRTAARWLFCTALVVLIAGLGAEIAHAIGSALAAAEVLPSPEAGGAVTTTGHIALQVPVWPIGAALALGALGAVFQHGYALQRETEGLV